MAARPYRYLRIDELDRLFSESRDNESCLRAILTELGYRTTARAIDLKQRVEKHLKSARSTFANSTSPVRPQSPPTAKPAQSDLYQSRAAPTAGLARSPKVLPIQDDPHPPIDEQRPQPEPIVAAPGETPAVRPEAAKPELSPSHAPIPAVRTAAG
jgi:hypothetical protein